MSRRGKRYWRSQQWFIDNVLLPNERDDDEQWMPGRSVPLDAIEESSRDELYHEQTYQERWDRIRRGVAGKEEP